MHLLFVDSDMAFPPDLCSKLLGFGKALSVRHTLYGASTWRRSNKPATAEKTFREQGWKRINSSAEKFLEREGPLFKVTFFDKYLRTGTACRRISRSATGCEVSVERFGSATILHTGSFNFGFPILRLLEGETRLRSCVSRKWRAAVLPLNPLSIAVRSVPSQP